jgi:hypothetical protein
MAMESPKGGGLGETLQANRVPLALIGAGVALLIANNTGLTDRVVQDGRVDAARRRIGEIAGSLGGVATSAAKGEDAHEGSLLGPDGELLAGTPGTGGGNGWVHHAAGAARGAISSVRDAGGAVLDRASRYTGYAGEAGDIAKRVGDQVAERLQQDPWLIGVVGFVAGALLGSLLPLTRFEQEYVGEAREKLWDRASALGQETVERVRDIAVSTKN